MFKSPAKNQIILYDNGVQKTYHEIKYIEGGVNAQVYLYQSNGEYYAVKKFHNCPLNRLIKEANILEEVYPDASIHYQSHGEKACIIMPYWGDKMYADKLPDSSFENRVTLILNLAKAIKYMHDLNIVHGDIKAMNICVLENYSVRLCDFGCSTKVGEPFEDTMPKPRLPHQQYFPPEVYAAYKEKTLI